MRWKSLLLVLLATSVHFTMSTPIDSDSEYFYADPEADDALSLNSEIQQRPRKFYFAGIPRAIQPADANLIATTECEPAQASAASPVDSTPAPPPPETTTAAAPASGGGGGGGGNANDAATTAVPAASSSAPATVAPVAAPAAATIPVSTAAGGGGGTPDQEQKAKELHILVQHLYIAQARVQLEASEIKKAQAVANAAQQQLEEAANHVRAVTAALQTAQQEVAAAAIRAQTAQLQLAAHDQLLFAARQDVDALSSQMVGLQAAEGIAPPKLTFDVAGLLEKLKQPLAEQEKPTAIPAILQPPTTPKAAAAAANAASLQDFDYE